MSFWTALFIVGIANLVIDILTVVVVLLLMGTRHPEEIEEDNEPTHVPTTRVSLGLLDGRE